MTLQLFLSPAAVSRGTGRELGGARLGGGAPAVDWPEQAISAPLLGTTADSLRETWLADGPASAGVSEGIAWRRAGDLLYGVVELAEDEPFVPPAGFDTVDERSYSKTRFVFLSHGA